MSRLPVRTPLKSVCFSTNEGVAGATAGANSVRGLFLPRFTIPPVEMVDVFNCVCCKFLAIPITRAVYVEPSTAEAIVDEDGVLGFVVATGADVGGRAVEGVPVLVAREFAVLEVKRTAVKFLFCAKMFAAVVRTVGVKPRRWRVCASFSRKPVKARTSFSFCDAPDGGSSNILDNIWIRWLILVEVSSGPYLWSVGVPDVGSVVAPALKAGGVNTRDITWYGGNN